MQRALGCAVLLAAMAQGAFAAAARPLILASTSDLAALVQAVAGDAVELQVVMPAGADPHAFSLSATQVQAFGQADLIVYAHSHTHEFETALRTALPHLPALDWHDYAAQGASLRDVPGYPQNPHGPWLRNDNARAIARAVALRLEALGLPRAVLQARLALFEQELTAQEALAHRVVQERGLAGKPMLAVIPGVCDLIANFGVPVGDVLMAEGSGTVAGKRLEDAVAKLRSGAYSAIVCPWSMRQSRQGEAARQVARDSGAPLLYVHFLDTRLGRDTVLSQRQDEIVALAALGASAPPATAPAARLDWLWAVPAGLLGALLGLWWQRRRRRGQSSCGAGIFE